MIFRILAIISICILAISCEKSPTGIDYGDITDIRYGDHVQPLLNNRCISCHAGANAEAGLNLDSWQNLIKGSDYGEAIIAFDAENSVLIEMATKLTGGPHPAELNADTLRKAEVEFLARWIEEGARNDQDEVPYANSQHRLYVPSQNAAIVSVIDTEAMLVVRNIKLTELGYSSNSKPHHIAVEPDGQFWYVSLIDENTVVKFDNNNEKVGEAAVTIPALLAVRPGGTDLYVSRFMMGGSIPNSIGRINRTTMTLQDEINVQFNIPHCLTTSHSGDKIFTASLSENQAIIINAASNEVEEFIPLGQSQGPLQMTVSPDDQTLFVSAQLANKMLVIDLASKTILDEINVGSQPWHPTFTPDGGRVYVGNFGSNTVSVIDAASRTVETTISGNGLSQPHGIAVSADGNYIFLSNRNVSGQYSPRHDFGDNANVGTVLAINTTTNSIEKVMEVEEFASGLAVWENTN